MHKGTGAQKKKEEKRKKKKRKKEYKRLLELFWLRPLPGLPPLALGHGAQKKKEKEKKKAQRKIGAKIDRFSGGEGGSDLRVACTRRMARFSRKTC